MGVVLPKQKAIITKISKAGDRLLVFISRECKFFRLGERIIIKPFELDRKTNNKIIPDEKTIIVNVCSSGGKTRLVAYVPTHNKFFKHKQRVIVQKFDYFQKKRMN